LLLSQGTKTINVDLKGDTKLWQKKGTNVSVKSSSFVPRVEKYIGKNDIA
jgi:hypothetical protein